MQQVVRKSPSLQHISVRFNLPALCNSASRLDSWTPGGELILPFSAWKIFKLSFISRPSSGGFMKLPDSASDVISVLGSNSISHW